MSDDMLKLARSVALEVFHNCVDSDDGSHCLDTVVATAIISEAISSALSAERAAHAEARKALDKIIAKDRAIVGSGKSRVESDGIYAAIARRALTGGKKDG